MVVARNPTGWLAGLVVAGSIAAVIAIVGLPSLAGARFPSAATGAPADPRIASLQRSDLPAGLSACPTSGGIDQYLRQLQVEGSPSYEVTAKQWASFKSIGASAGYVSSFTRLPSDCAARLGERTGPSAISFTIRFRNSVGAASAFKTGFLGLRPEPGVVLPGLEQGASTRLAPLAWTYDQTGLAPSVYAAYWSRGTFDVFLLTERIAAGDSRRAADDINGRVR